MAQILDPLPSDNQNRIFCCYVNATSQIQIARITNIPNWYFERVVFPGQRLVFETLPEALLEIHTGMMATAILSDTIPCDRLLVEENSDDFPMPVATQAAEPSASRSSVEIVNTKKNRVAKESLTLAARG
jgi:hypothetical protein